MTPEVARARIALRPELRAFITLTSESGAGDLIAVKDVFDVEGLPTTSGWRGGQSPAERDSSVIATARRGGCIVIGKTNLDPWCCGALGVNPDFGDIRNPRAVNRLAGGSSGGSSAAVAAGLCDWAIGTDSAGSVRIPASLCGVVGFKPTFGWADLSGVAPHSPSLETVGILAPTVAAVSRAFTVLGGAGAGADSRAIQSTRAGHGIAVPAQWIYGLDPATSQTWHRVSQGLPTVELPERDRFVAARSLIAVAEAAHSNHSLLVSRPEAYTPKLARVLRAGLRISADELAAARRAADDLRSELMHAMDDFDALLLPTTAATAPLATRPGPEEPLVRFTSPFSLTGQPSISVPGPSAGLPVGVQLVGRPGKDIELLQIAANLEQQWQSD